MEHESEHFTTTFLCLNDDCLLQIFELLELNDCMSVAETCSKFKQIMQRIYRIKFAVDFSLSYDWINHDNTYVDRIFFHLGSYLTSLDVWEFTNAEYILRKIDKNSSNFYKKLKTLILSLLRGNDFQNISSMSGLRNLEVLTLYQCDLRNDAEFFKHFCHLKFLNIEQCDNLHEDALNDTFFKDNPNMKGFAIQSTDGFQLKTLYSLANLERFTLVGDYVDLDLSLLAKFNRLTNLKLTGYTIGTVINDILSGLTKTGIMEELYIGDFSFTFDKDSYAALKKLEKLQLLVLTDGDAITWNSSFTLPLNLKHLGFEWFKISTTSIAAFIKQLPNLENLNLRECEIVDRKGTAVSDFKSICHQISIAMDRDDNQQIINVLIDTWFPTLDLEEKSIAAGRLRFFSGSKYFVNSDVFRVNFPGSTM